MLFLITNVQLTNLNADPVSPSCNDVINACDKALDAKDNQIKIRDLGIGLRDDQITGLKKDNADLEHYANAWYNNHYLYLFLGMGVGIFVASKL